MTSAHTDESGQVRVTCTDLASGESESQDVRDDYVMVAVGTAEVTGIQVHHKSAGTSTHVITVKGVRRG